MNHLSLRHLSALAALSILASVSPASAVTLLPQEQAIAQDMITNPGQGRPYMVLDPTIEAVARARAEDMGVRNYFSHVNPDGVAANYLLRQAGYQLPAWWGTDPAANYVESIASGYPDPSDTWTQWMNSPPHKVHLLGQNSFFATETHYGVGYYFDASSTYQYYWVVITAPPEPVEIMSPDPDALVTGTTVTVSGLSDPGTNPASVQFRVENAGGIGAYQPAMGLASWSGTASGLVPGSNVIRAQSLDGSGNVIAETTCHVTCIVPTTLTVSVSGSGSVTAGYAGATIRHVGNPLTLTAYPAPGSVFTGWTGSIVSGSAAIHFTVQPGISLQANFEPSPFVPVVGPYYGILTSGSGGQAGFVHLVVSEGGCFTGRVIIGGTGYTFVGTLDLTGSATITIPVPGQSPLTLSIQADLTGGTGQITGSITDGGDTFSFGASQATYNPITNVAPQAGRYTLVLSPDPDVTGTNVPQGSGYAAIVVYPGGAVTLNGRLADGSPYAALGHLANDGTVAIYCVPSGAPAGSSLTGLLTFRSTNVSDLDGTLTWTKAAQPANPFYPAGFSTALPAVGSLFAAPAPGLQAMDVSPGAATAAFAAGNLPQTLDVPIVINQADTAVMASRGSPDLTLSINPVSGTVSGTFVMPDGNLLRGVRGVVLQKQQTAYGYFRGIDQCGSFSMTPGS